MSTNTTTIEQSVEATQVTRPARKLRTRFGLALAAVFMALTATLAGAAPAQAASITSTVTLCYKAYYAGYTWPGTSASAFYSTSGSGALNWAGSFVPNKNGCISLNVTPGYWWRFGGSTKIPGTRMECYGNTGTFYVQRGFNYARNVILTCARF